MRTLERRKHGNAGNNTPEIKKVPLSMNLDLKAKNKGTTKKEGLALNAQEHVRMMNYEFWPAWYYVVCNR
jgi:hypothetical protein